MREPPLEVLECVLNFHRDSGVYLIHFQTFLLSLCQDEVTKMKRKLQIMTHQVDQLKEEISAKESALVKLHLEQQRIEKEKDTLKVQILYSK